MKKCKICNTEFKSSYKRRVACSDKCKLENKAINKRWSSHKGLAVDTESPLIVWKNTFLLRA